METSIDRIFLAYEKFVGKVLTVKERKEIEDFLSNKNSFNKGCRYKDYYDTETNERKKVFGIHCCDCSQQCDDFMKWFAGPKGR